MTGISKFTKAGVFSTLNNLYDLSLDKKFGALLGYTEQELVEKFDEYLETGINAEALKQIHANRYAAPYANAKKLGIAIDDTTRQVGKWAEG